MQINVTVKQLGRKRDKIGAQPFLLSNTPATLRELICEAVHTCVSRFRQNETPKYSTAARIDEMSEIGKIAIGIHYGGERADEKKAMDTAVQAFEDGLFRVFHGDTELTCLDETIMLKEGDPVTFIRLIMLSGGMW